MDILQKQIKEVVTAAVCFGEAGIGYWQNKEINAFLIRRCRIIVVILKNAPKELEMPIFLQAYQHIDFRIEDPNPVDELIEAIALDKIEKVHNTQLLSQQKDFILEKPEISPEAHSIQENESIGQEEQDFLRKDKENLREVPLDKGKESTEQEVQDGRNSENLKDAKRAIPLTSWQMEKPQVHRKRKLRHVDSEAYRCMIRTIDGDDLISERGVDYRSLQITLREAMWREADLETHELISNVMFKESRKSNQGLFREELIEFPCADLLTLDRLWTRYSNRRFGFSIQKSIWEKHGCPGKMGENWNNFCIDIGWKDPMNAKYLSYMELKMNPLISPTGELPSGLYFFRSLFGGFFVKKFQTEVDGCDLFYRLKKCGL